MLMDCSFPGKNGKGLFPDFQNFFNVTENPGEFSCIHKYTPGLLNSLYSTLVFITSACTRSACTRSA